MTTPGSRLAILCVLVLAAFVPPLPSASAGGDNYVVTKTADTNDGLCNADCSLREAVIAANGGLSPTISIPAGVYVLDLVGAGENDAATGDLDLRGGMIIGGAGAGKTIIDGNLTDRVFDIPFGPVLVSLHGVTVRNGRTTDTGGAGINNEGTLNLGQSIVSGNKDVGTSSSYSIGGGIKNGGTLHASDLTISRNSAIRGGGLFTNDMADLTRVTLSGNGATTGAGIVNYGTLSVTASTISGNSATSSAGALAHSAGSMTVTSSTIASNESATYGSIRNDTGGLEMRNTIVSGNSAPNCHEPVTSSGFNLEDTDTCGFSDPTDSPDTDPTLQALAANGGLTKTMALLPGSPAIDLGDSGCGRDQRGVPRPQGASCDAGSYELALCASKPVNVVGTNAADMLFGSAAVDVFLALGGADIVKGGDGNDRVCGGAGKDTLNGQLGDDTLNGGPDADTCDGGAGNDAAVSCETQLHIP
jgi:CSLREA domain-containing protein